MSLGPMIVAVQCSMLPSASGKAEMPGVGESMRVISSDCNLQVVLEGRCAGGEWEDEPFSDALCVGFACWWGEFLLFGHGELTWGGVLVVFVCKLHVQKCGLIRLGYRVRGRVRSVRISMWCK